MYRFITIALIIVCSLTVLHAQTPAPPAPAKPALDPDVLAEDWIKRLNSLDHWTLTVDGKEQGIDDVVNSMMELYAPDVLAEVPPHDPDQIGSVMLRGPDNVRKWIEEIARTQVRLTYIIRRQTTKETEGIRLIYSKPLPWGGVGISFQILATYSNRQDRRWFMSPGAVFLQYREDGKIERLRLLLSETGEVVSY
jgi:hypothetical protein